MSKEQQNIDKLIQDKLSDRSFGTPPEAFINDINKRLDKTNQKPFKSYLFSILSSLMFVVFLMVLFIPHEYKYSIRYQKNLLGKANQQSTTIEDNKKDIASKEQALPLNPTDKIKEIVTIKNDFKINDKNQVSLDHRAQLSKNDKHNTTSAEQIKKEHTKVSNIESNKESNKESNIESNKEKSKQKESHLTENNPTNKTNQVEIKSGIKTSKEQPENTEISELIRRGNIGEYRMITAIELPLIHENINDEAFFTIDSSPLIPEPVFNSTVVKKPESKKKLNYEVQLYAGVGFDQAKINNTISDEYATQLNLQSENEISPLIGASFKVIYKDLVFGSGLAFSQHREDNDFKLKTTITTDSVYFAYYDYVYIYDSLNNPYDSVQVAFYDTTQVSKEELNEYEIEQNYSWLQIPIHFGYRFQLNKWAITPSVGINFAIGIRNKSMRYPDQNFEQFEQFSAMKWHMNIQGNLEVRRTINQWHIFARGSYNYGITPVLKSSLFHRKYNGINGAIGLGYSF